MILDELVLHNFGVYRGRQRFALTPESPERPIVLIGAQNGSGKTTFLEGLQLAFFGRLALPILRGGGAYEDFLGRAINRTVPPHEGAEVQATFRRTTAGQEQTITIRRAWSVQKSGVKEVFEAVVDGKLDRVLTAHWAEFIEELLPPRIAPLFFFDGERIEQFADLDRSADVIRTAVSALLGLDIVDQLGVDLEVLERRKAAAHANADLQAELQGHEKAVSSATGAHEAAHRALAQAKAYRDRRLSQLEEARLDFQTQGGDLFGSREALLSERARLEASIQSVSKALRAWAGEAAPLLLVEGLLSDTLQQGHREAKSQEVRTVLQHALGRDAATLQLLQLEGAPKTLIASVHRHFERERAQLAAQVEGDNYLDLSLQALHGAQALQADGLPTAVAARDAMLDELEQLESARDDLDRRIASIPAPETVAPLMTAVADAERALAEAEANLIVAERDFETADRLLAQARSAYQAKLQRHVDHSLQAEDAQRLIAHSARVRDTLARFRGEVVQHHVHQIERLLLDCLRELLRKDDLVVDVRIDPKTFAIELHGGGWERLPPEQLSAGERQLFAVALLWALAKASGQAAPTVIDTPLGRLDSVHRARLVDRYFGFAGEQVILLSTDEEIDAALYERLEPRISRSYTVAYSPDDKGSQAEPGYAFAENTLEAA